jgi:glycopeptide antibiotics resistance protein
MPQTEKSPGKKLDKKVKTLGHIIFWVYFGVLLYMTLFTYNYYVYGQSFNIVPFESIKLMWHSGDYWLILKNVFGNIVLFLPLGFLMPMVLKRMRSFFKTAGIGFLISFTIEIIQYGFAERIFDIDDILLNGLGAVIGYIIFKIGYFIYTIIKRNI